jgi:hypothetical protein
MVTRPVSRMERQMSRKPLDGVRAMTDVERQRKSRAARGIGGPHRIEPAPWLGNPPTGTRREAEIINGLYKWLDNAAADTVAGWLAWSIMERDDSATVLDATRRCLARGSIGSPRP